MELCRKFQTFISKALVGLFLREIFLHVLEACCQNGSRRIMSPLNLDNVKTKNIDCPCYLFLGLFYMSITFFFDTLKCVI